MADLEIRDANLQLLIDLKEHLETAERLRQAYEQLLALASASVNPDTPAKAKAVRHVAR